MENKNYKIKKTGTEKNYGGATRCSKEGKGRYDLIPEDVIIKCFERYHEESYVMFPKALAFKYALIGDYINAVTFITQSKYHDYDGDDDKRSVMCEFTNMVRDLAIHFQKGAEMYGERNCEKGIPLWSFRDSGIRHLIQYINGETDEPHYISAIWNFVMAEWTKIHHPERCDKAGLSLNDNDKKIEDCDNSTTTETSTTYHGTSLSESPHFNFDNKTDDNNDDETSPRNDFIMSACCALKYIDELMNKDKCENMCEKDSNDNDVETLKDVCNDINDKFGNVNSDDIAKWDDIIINNIKKYNNNINTLSLMHYLKKYNNDIKNTLSLMHGLFISNLLWFVPIEVKVVSDRQYEHITTKISPLKEPFSKNSKNDKCISLTVKSSIVDGMCVINITDDINSESIEISLHCYDDGIISIDFRKHSIDEHIHTILNLFYNKFLKHGGSLNREYFEEFLEMMNN